MSQALIDSLFKITVSINIFLTKSAYLISIKMEHLRTANDYLIANFVVLGLPCTFTTSSG